MSYDQRRGCNQLIQIRMLLGKIQDYVQKGEADYYADPRHQEAMIYLLLQVTEILKELPTQWHQDFNQQLNWSVIFKMRERLVHHYVQIKVDMVWDVVSGSDLDEVSRTVEEMLERYCQ